jgi:PAS domain S-box-containing protein
MIKLRGSLSRKLTTMNMLVSAGSLLLASAAFFAYDYYTFRKNLVRNTSIEGQIIGANVGSSLIFDDIPSAQNTLSALRASPNVVYAGIYNANGIFFAGYWRDRSAHLVSLPPFKLDQREHHWFEEGMLGSVQTILFDGKPVGTIYMRVASGALYERLRTYAMILCMIVGTSLIAALMLSRVSQRAVTQPILRLADTARTVSRDKDYSLRVPWSADHDEVAVLVDAFNEMLVEIQNRDSALQESEEQFRNLANSIPQLAWMAEADGNMFWFNERWYQYTGTTPEQVAGWGWQSLHDPALLSQVLLRWRTSLATGHPFEMIIPLRGADGNFRDFLTRALPVRDAQRTIVRWFGTLTDITEQRRSEEALRQTEKLAATGRLAASIAHEINNPLETVTNLVYLARKQPANVEKYLSLADQELDRIAQITRHTLGFYRDSASPKMVDVSNILQEVLVLYARKLQFKKIKVRSDYAAGAEVEGYGGEIRQIFANLVANAIEAMPVEGTLRIRVGKVGAASDGRSGVRITLLDNGVGIPAQSRKKIFEPFYTTKKDVGTGLGLWLTQNLVEKHKGSVQFRSCAEAGRSWTAFSVFLPEQM